MYKHEGLLADTKLTLQTDLISTPLFTSSLLAKALQNNVGEHENLSRDASVGYSLLFVSQEKE